MKFEFRINLKKVIILRTLKIEYPRFIIYQGRIFPLLYFPKNQNTENSEYSVCIKIIESKLLQKFREILIPTFTKTNHKTEAKIVYF